MKRLMLLVALAAVLICWPIACVRGHLSKVRARNHYLQLKSGDATMTPVALVVDGTKYGPGFTINDATFLAQWSRQVPRDRSVYHPIWGSNFGRLHFADGTSIGVYFHIYQTVDALTCDIEDFPPYTDMMDYIDVDFPEPVPPSIHAIFERLRHPPSYAKAR